MWSKALHYELSTPILSLIICCSYIPAQSLVSSDYAGGGKYYLLVCKEMITPCAVMKLLLL